MRDVWVLVTQSCPTLHDPMDCSPPGSSVHAILQARILEWVAIPFSRGSSWHRDRTLVSCISGRFFTVWVTREALFYKQTSLSFFCLFLTAQGLCCCSRLFLVAESGGYSLAAVQRLLTAVASPVEEHGLCSMWASVVMAPGLVAP